jgi:predicted membrane protein
MKIKTKTKKILEKTRRIANRIFWIVWIIIGILISLWTGSIYAKMNSQTGLGIIAWVILFTIGIYLLALYAGATLLILLIKLIIKIIKRARKKK